MTKVTIMGIVATLCLALTCGMVGAVVHGPCVNCHTMHNSQNGVAVDATGPHETLLLYDCMGCHGQKTANNIEFGNTTPQVWHSNGTDLAGGNFAYISGLKARVTGTSSTVGHNVNEIGFPEATAAMFPPPGNEFTENNVITDSTKFTCAGTNGCHGDRTISGGSMAAIRGSHHVNDSVLKFGAIDESKQGGSTALSYRFLKGVHGGEINDWQNTDASHHNEYKGAINRGAEGTYSTPGGNSISGLCAECHGDFHGTGTDSKGGPDIGTGPWYRHPTDIVLPNDVTKEYRLYNGGIGTNNPYSVDAPVGRATISNAVSAVVNPGTDDSIVLCLSCHKVHGSEYADILRWDYSTINAGGGETNTKCFICHTTKDTGS